MNEVNLHSYVCTATVECADFFFKGKTFNWLSYINGQQTNFLPMFIFQADC